MEYTLINSKKHVFFAFYQKLLKQIALNLLFCKLCYKNYFMKRSTFIGTVSFGHWEKNEAKRRTAQLLNT